MWGRAVPLRVTKRKVIIILLHIGVGIFILMSLLIFYLPAITQGVSLFEQWIMNLAQFIKQLLP
jgi:hypothetical protein